MRAAEGQVWCSVYIVVYLALALTEKPQEETGWCKCSTQLLHLSALHPRQLQIAKPAELQHRLPARSFVSHKGLRGESEHSSAGKLQISQYSIYKVRRFIIPQCHCSCLVKFILLFQVDYQLQLRQLTGKNHRKTLSTG